MAIDAQAAPDCARLNAKHLRKLAGAERPGWARRKNFLQGGKGLIAEFLGGSGVYGLILQGLSPGCVSRQKNQGLTKTLITVITPCNIKIHDAGSMG